MRIKLLLALAITASTLSPLEERQNNYRDAHRNVLSDSYYRPPDLISSDSAHNRVYRAAGEESNLKTLLSQMQMVARITNGVSLQRELYKGSIPSDRLIAELLSFGNATPAQIISIDNSKIQLAIDTMKQIPEGLKASGIPEVAEVEKALKVMESIIGGPIDSGISMNKSVMPDFKESIESLSSNEVVDKVLSDMDNVKVGWVSHDAIKVKNKKFAKEYFANVKRALTIIKRKGTESKKTGPIWNSKKFTSAMESLVPISNVATVADKYKGQLAQLSRTPEQWAAYSRFIGDFQKKIDLLKSPYSDVQAVKSVVMGQQSKSRVKEFSFTSGFPAGPSDVALMFVDLTDAWIKETIKTDQLHLALEQLRNMEVLAKKVEDELKGNGQMANDIKLLFDVIDSFHSSATDEKAIQTGVADAQKCVLPQDPIASNVVNDIKTMLQTIDNGFKTVGERLADFSKVVTAIEFSSMCDDVIAICDESKPASDEELDGIIDKFEQYAKLEELKANMSTIRTAVEEIEKAVKIIQDEAKKVGTKLTDLDTFHNASTVLGTYLSCLKTKTHLQPLFDIMAETEKLRTFDQTQFDKLDSGLNVVKTVAKTGDDLKRLEKIIASDTPSSNNYKEELLRFEDADRHAATIGVTVQVVSNMKNALEKRSEVEGYVKNMDMEVVKKYNINTTASSDLDALLQLNISVIAMFSTLEHFKNSLSIKKGTNLSDQAEIFNKAVLVTGINGDVQKMRDAVVKLKELNGTTPEEKLKMETIMSELEKLEAMGMEFASYQTAFQSVKESLVAFDSFFVQFLGAFAMTSEEPMIRNEESSGFPILIIVFILIGLLLVVAIGHFIWNKKANESFYLFYYRFYTHPNWGNPPESCLNTFVKAMTAIVEKKYEEEKEKNPLLEHKHVFQMAFEEHYKKNDQIAVEGSAEKDVVPVFCANDSFYIIKATAPRLSAALDSKVHANVVELGDRKKLVLVETPRHANKQLKKEETVENYWKMVVEMKAKMIIQYREAGCPNFFPFFASNPPVYYGSVKVTCKKQWIPDDETIMFVFAIKIGKRKAHIVTLYMLSMTNKKNPQQMAQLLKSVFQQKMPVIVGCLDGGQHSGKVAFSAIMISMIMTDPKADNYNDVFEKALRQLRKSRLGCVKNDPQQYAHCAMIVLEYLCLDRKEKTSNKVDSLREGWEQWGLPAEPPVPPTPVIPDTITTDGSTTSTSKISLDSGATPSTSSASVTSSTGTPEPVNPDPLLERPNLDDIANDKKSIVYDPNKKPDEEEESPSEKIVKKRINKKILQPKPITPPGLLLFDSSKDLEPPMTPADWAEIDRQNKALDAASRAAAQLENEKSEKKRKEKEAELKEAKNLKSKEGEEPKESKNTKSKEEEEPKEPKKGKKNRRRGSAETVVE